MRLRTRSNEFDIRLGDAVITVSPLTSGEMSSLRRKYTRIKRGQEQTDGHGLSQEMFRRIVRRWSGINDEDDSPIDCTEDGKHLVFENNPDFVGDVLERVEAELQERREAAEGNLTPGPDGT